MQKTESEAGTPQPTGTKRVLAATPPPRNSRLDPTPDETLTRFDVKDSLSPYARDDRGGDRSLRAGSLFSGYGGLDLAVEEVFGASTAWQVEFDENPSRILAHHWNVPNYGDVTSVDWSAVEPVDVLCGGFPCQDLSLAGRRAGMRPGTRSGLWGDFLTAITVLRPQYVVIENVRGLLSACAESDLEPCPGCVGGGEHRPPVRALGRVLGDLANIGYDAIWHGLEASDVGAPHHRFRVFVLAYPQGVGRGERRAEPARIVGRSDAPLSGSEVAYATRDEGRFGDGNGATVADPGCVCRVTGWQSAPGQEESGRTSGVACRCGGEAFAHAGCSVVAQHPGEPSSEEAGAASGDGSVDSGGERLTQDWGPYLDAIRRWEHATGHVAPLPTFINPKGTTKESPAFAEWMMGLEPGWVTDPAIWEGSGLTTTATENAQLKAIGNGVVPRQAAEAIRWCLAQLEAVAS